MDGDQGIIGHDVASLRKVYLQQNNCSVGDSCSTEPSSQGRKKLRGMVVYGSINRGLRSVPQPLQSWESQEVAPETEEPFAFVDAQVPRMPFVLQHTKGGETPYDAVAPAPNVLVSPPELILIYAIYAEYTRSTSSIWVRKRYRRHTSMAVSVRGLVA